VTKFVNWLGNRYQEPEKVLEAEPWSSVQSPMQIQPSEPQHPAPVPTGVEKNTDSVWAEFESVVPEEYTPQPDPVTRDEDWVDTLSQNDFVDTLAPVGFEDTVRSGLDES
jgi:hypothetical protein